MGLRLGAAGAPLIIPLFKYKSTSRSKLYLNPLHRHFVNRDRLLAIYYRLGNEKRSQSATGIFDRMLVDVY